MGYILYSTNNRIKGENFLHNTVYKSLDRAKIAIDEYITDKSGKDVSEFDKISDNFMHSGIGKTYNSYYGNYPCSVIAVQVYVEE